MKKIIFLTSLFILSIFICQPPFAFSQKSKRPVRKQAQKPPKEEDASVKLLLSMSEPIAWKTHYFPNDGFAISFPRTPITSTEVLSDPSLGKLTLKLHTSMGDSSIFIIGKIALPYPITDDGVAKMLREKAMEGVAESGTFEWSRPVEIKVKDRDVLEAHGQEKGGGNARFRSFLIGKTFFYQLAMTMAPAENPDRDKKETDDYFDSFSPIVTVVQAPATPSNPIFKSSFNNGIYTSDFFGFTMTPPEGWRLADEEEMMGIREHGRGLMEENSTIDTTEMSKDRKTLFLFSLKGLGADRNFMMNCTVLKMPSAKVTGAQFTQVMESMIGKTSIYKLVQRTRPVRLGKNTFSSFDMKGELAGFSFEQSVFVIVKKGYALSFSATYDADSKPLVMEAMNSIVFRAAR